MRFLRRGRYVKGFWSHSRWAPSVTVCRQFPCRASDDRDLRLAVIEGNGAVHASWIDANLRRSVEVYPTHWQGWRKISLGIGSSSGKCATTEARVDHALPSHALELSDSTRLRSQHAVFWAAVKLLIRNGDSGYLSQLESLMDRPRNR
jgi:hypothetical protein